MILGWQCGYRRVHGWNARSPCSTRVFIAACIAMVEAAQPVLVIVDGPAIGGGAELIAYGDLVIATPRARFALPEITIGMFPPLASTQWGSLPHIIGPKRALELVLTGEAITAEVRATWPGKSTGSRSAAARRPSTN